MRRTLMLSFLVCLMACGCSSGENADTPQAAKGDTPIRFVICNSSSTGCFVSARFKSFEGCENYKRWAGMRCDNVSIPGEMVCREVNDSLVTAYCTQ